VHGYIWTHREAAHNENPTLSLTLILILILTLTLTLICRLPSNIVQFDETVPKERPMQPGGRTDPHNERRQMRVQMDQMNYQDANTIVQGLEDSSRFDFR